MQWLRILVKFEDYYYDYNYNYYFWGVRCTLIVLILKSDAVRVLILVGATEITAVIITVVESKILCLN